MSEADIKRALPTGVEVALLSSEGGTVRGARERRAVRGGRERGCGGAGRKTASSWRARRDCC